MTRGGFSLKSLGGHGANGTLETTGKRQFSPGGGATQSDISGDVLYLHRQSGQGGLIDGAREFFTGNGRDGAREFFTGNGRDGDAQLGRGGPYINGNGRAGTGYSGGGAGAGMIPGLILRRSG